MEYLLSSLLFSVLIAVAFKLFSRLSVNVFVAIAVNYLICVGLGLLMIQQPPDLKTITQQSWFGISLICGIMLFVVFHLFSFSTERAGIALTAIASKMSVIIPAAAGIMFFAEENSLIKIVGIICTLFAFYFIFRREEQISFSKNIIFPFLVFLGNGANDILLKTAQYHHIQTPEEYILFLGFAFFISSIAGITSLMYHLLTLSTKLFFNSVFAGILLGGLNWFSTYYYFRGLGMMPVSVFIPLFNVLYVLITVAIGVIVFRERFRLMNFIGVLIAVLAIFMLLHG